MAKYGSYRLGLCTRGLGGIPRLKCTVKYLVKMSSEESSGLFLVSFSPSLREGIEG